MFSPFDQQAMDRALELARLGRGRTSPNPMVGAVVARDQKIVGEGYHRQAGGPHAEVFALDQAGPDARSATLYVTLEPCCHFGSTPPCTDAILRAGIRRVVAAMEDPHDKVAGKGIRQLREAGVQVEVGLRQEEAKRLNEAFIVAVTLRRPFVVAKYAMTLDGRIAAASGDSRWITGESARLMAHRLRDQSDAIMVGVGTVLADDPALTCRLPEGNGRDPVRVILDRRGRTPLNAQVVNLKSSAPTWIFTTDRSNPSWRSEMEAKGARVFITPETDGRVDLRTVMIELHAQGIRQLLVEGGSEVLGSFLERRWLDRAWVFIAPKVIGGRDAPGPIGGQGLSRMADALGLAEVEWEQVGADLILQGRFEDVHGLD